MRTFILTEAGKDIGFGHLTRCISLYQAFEERGIIPQFIVNGDNSILDLLKDKNYQIFNWLKEKIKLFKTVTKADIVIIDSYLAELDFYEDLSASVRIPVYIDDNKRIDYPRGLVVNGTIYAKEMGYTKRDGVTYLLGAKYLPLRKTFWEVSEKKINKKLETVMVTFGGDDSRGMTKRILKLLIEHYPEITKKIVIGRSFKNIEEIEKLNDAKTELIYYPDAEGMKKIMIESDIGISAGGHTPYELARVGVPGVAICVAESQLQNIKGWQKTGFLEYAGWYAERDILKKLRKAIARLENPDVRRFRSDIGKKLIDGKGSLRIAKTICNSNCRGNS